MAKECMNCGHISDDTQEDLTKCANCEVYFHKFEARSQKLATEQGLTLTEYFAQSKSSRLEKQRELEANKKAKDKLARLTLEKQKWNETVKRLQCSNGLSDIPNEELIDVINSTYITSTDFIPGYATRTLIGIVSSESLLNKEALTNCLMESSPLAHHCSNVKKLLADARNEAIKELKLEAVRANGNAVVGVKFEHLELSSANKMLVIATGTALFVEEITEVFDADPVLSITNISNVSRNGYNPIGRAADLAYLSEIMGEESDIAIDEAVDISIFDLFDL
jgi:uncharacterized protein YbjQ (UPF0145 family)